MAETIKIVDLDIDQAELLKKLTKLTDEITELKTETKKLETANKELDKEGKKNTQQYKDNSTQIEKNKIQTKELSTEYRNNQNTLVALNSTETKQLGTLQQLELSNKKLREEAKRLDLTQKSGQKRLKDINKQLDQNNKTVLKNADAMKAQKMNIGAYGSALQGMGGPLTNATRGIGMLNVAFKLLIANPIGLILAAIALAIKAIGDAISKNQGMLDRFKAIGDGLSASYNVLLDRINGIGKAIKALGKLNFKTIKEGFKGIGEEIVAEFKAAKQLREELQALEDQEIGDIVRKAELRQAVEKARLASKEANITETERLRLVDVAIAKEEELLIIEMEAAVERARISQEQIDLGDSTRKEIEANELLQAKVIETETASLKRRRTLASERKTLAVKASKETLDLAEQEALAAAKAVDNELALVSMKSIAINEIKDQDVEKDKERAEQIKATFIELTDAEIELATLVGQVKLDLAQSYLKGIAMLFGAQSAVGKAAAVAETAINTYRGAQAAYASLAGIPVVGPGLGIAAAGAAVLMGLANVRKIFQVKTPGGGGAGGGGGGMPSGGGMRVPISSSSMTADGGLTTQGIKPALALTKGAMVEALNESAQKNVLVIDEVTAKQGTQESISQVTTV